MALADVDTSILRSDDVAIVDLCTYTCGFQSLLAFLVVHGLLHRGTVVRGREAGHWRNTFVVQEVWQRVRVCTSQRQSTAQ